MLKIFVGGQDITENYVQFTYSKKEALKNRSNKCSFTINDYRVIPNQIVNIWDTTLVSGDSLSGSNTIVVRDTFEVTSKFNPGQKITVNIQEQDQRDYAIDSIDHVTNTITLTENLTRDVLSNSLIGIRQFGGVTMRTPEQEVSKSDDFKQSITCTDFKKLLDRENVAETFLDQYAREIFGRVLYEFAANDSQEDIDRMDNPRTEGGTADPMVQEPIDRIFSNFSQRTGLSTGVGFWERSFTVIDMSSYEHIRLWRKVAEGEGVGITSFKVRIGSDSGNYFEYDIPRVGEEYEDCRNYEAAKLYAPDAIVGSPDLSSVSYIRYEMTASQDVDDILFDHVFVSSGGFTLMDTIRGNVKFEDIRIKQKKISETFEAITRLNQEGWFVGYDRDIAYYIKDERTQAPIEITETSKEFGDLVIQPDTTDLRNRQLVIGGEAVEQILYTQEEVSDGKKESYRLDYKFDDIRVFVDVGGTGNFVEKTVGIENLTDPTTVEFLANFAEKIIKVGEAPSAAPLDDGDVFRTTYFPYKPITYRYEDGPSIDKMKTLTGGNGVYDGEVIIDRTILTQEEAFLRAKAEVDEFKNPLVDCTFATNKDNITVGQLVTITDSNRDIDDTYLIQKVSCKHVGKSFFEYKITAATTLFGITEFLQMLLRRSINLFFDQDAVVFIVKNQAETITIQDAYELFKKSNDFLAGQILRKNRDFIYETGVYTFAGITELHKLNRDIAYGGSQSGELSFDASTDHNNGKAMQLTTNESGVGDYMEVFDRYIRPISSNTDHLLEYWTETLSVVSSQPSGDVIVFVREYDNTDTLIATTQLSSGIEVKDFKHYALQFTTNINTVGYKIGVGVYDVEGVFQIADIKLTEQVPFVVGNPGIADFSEAL